LVGDGVNDEDNVLGHNVRDFEHAVNVLEHAVDVALEISNDERYADDDAFINAVLARVAKTTDQQSAAPINANVAPARCSSNRSAPGTVECCLATASLGIAVLMHQAPAPIESG